MKQQGERRCASTVLLMRIYMTELTLRSEIIWIEHLLPLQIQSVRNRIVPLEIVVARVEADVYMGVVHRFSTWSYFSIVVAARVLQGFFVGSRKRTCHTKMKVKDSKSPSEFLSFPFSFLFSVNLLLPKRQQLVAFPSPVFPRKKGLWAESATSSIFTLPPQHRVSLLHLLEQQERIPDATQDKC